MKNAINWFEIPVKNIDAAKKFYETVIGKEMQGMEAMGMKTAFFHADLGNGIGGCITEGPGYEPANNGTVVYLNGGDDLGEALSRVEAAGGKIVMPKTGICENGFMAVFIDVDGNKVGLHSTK